MTCKYRYLSALTQYIRPFTKQSKRKDEDYMIIKIFIALAILSISVSSFAGDLALVCYKNQDQGDYIALSDEFMSTNKKAMQFDDQNNQYTVLVNRKSLFEDYQYEIIIINKSNNDYHVEKISTSRYDDAIDLNDQIQCKIID